MTQTYTSKNLFGEEGPLPSEPPPSIEILEARIAQLEQDNAELRDEIEELESEIAALGTDDYSDDGNDIDAADVLERVRREIQRRDYDYALLLIEREIGL